MPAVSDAQQHYAGMSKTAKGRAILRKHGKKPMPPAVADEYAHKSKPNLPKHVLKKPK